MIHPDDPQWELVHGCPVPCFPDAFTRVGVDWQLRGSRAEQCYGDLQQLGLAIGGSGWQGATFVAFTEALAGLSPPLLRQHDAFVDAGRLMIDLGDEIARVQAIVQTWLDRALDAEARLIDALARIEEATARRAYWAAEIGATRQWISRAQDDHELSKAQARMSECIRWHDRWADALTVAVDDHAVAEADLADARAHIRGIGENHHDLMWLKAAALERLTPLMVLSNLGLGAMLDASVGLHADPTPGDPEGMYDVIASATDLWITPTLAMAAGVAGANVAATLMGQMASDMLPAPAQAIQADTPDWVELISAGTGDASPVVDGWIGVDATADMPPLVDLAGLTGSDESEAMSVPSIPLAFGVTVASIPRISMPEIVIPQPIGYVDWLGALSGLQPAPTEDWLGTGDVNALMTATELFVAGGGVPVVVPLDAQAFR